MGVVEDSSGDCQEFGESLVAERLWLVAQPSRQGGVGTDDPPVRMSDDMTTRSGVPEVLDAAICHGVRAKFAIADAVASGALTCGQCPVASSVTSWLPWTCAWT